MNAALPPLAFRDNEFDPIYGVSVFTHLPADCQKRWLPQFARILRPGGILLLTVHGERAWRQLDDATHQRLRREGFLFQTSTKLRGILPEWYHTAFPRKNMRFRRWAHISGCWPMWRAEWAIRT